MYRTQVRPRLSHDHQSTQKTDLRLHLCMDGGDESYGSAVPHFRCQTFAQGADKPSRRLFRQERRVLGVCAEARVVFIGFLGSGAASGRNVVSKGPAGGAGRMLRHGDKIGGPPVDPLSLPGG